MQGVVFHGPRDMRLEEVEYPKLTSDTAVVKIIKVAICATDLKIYLKGHRMVTPPAILGHEFLAEIVEVGSSVKGYSIGDKVTMATTISCGVCEYCRVGRGNLCENKTPVGTMLSGAFAEYMLVPASGLRGGNLVKVPDDLDPEWAALAEPISCILNAQEIAGVSIGKSVAVLGAGALGCLHIEVAKALGAVKVFAASATPARLELLKKFDVDEIIDVKKTDLLERIKALTDGKGVDVVLVTAPKTSYQELAPELTRKMGVVNLFASLPPDNAMLNLNSRSIHYNEIAITGASDSRPEHVEKAVKLMQAGRFNVAPVITHRFPLAEIEKGLAVMKTLEGLKVILTP